MMEVISLLRAFIFAMLYGFMENRVFFEADMDYAILKHFKLYHLCMLELFAIVSFSTSIVTWIFCLVMMPLVQDATWWAFQGRLPEQQDWVNWGGLPLILHLPLIYWIQGFVLLIIAVLFA